MKKAIIGKKIGMTQIFDEVGNVVPVTVIEVGPCVVAQKKTVEKDGYNALQLGFMEVKAKHMTKAEIGHFEKAGVAYKKHLKEFRLDDCSANVGDVITVDLSIPFTINLPDGIAMTPGETLAMPMTFTPRLFASTATSTGTPLMPEVEATISTS